MASRTRDTLIAAGYVLLVQSFASTFFLESAHSDPGYGEHSRCQELKASPALTPFIDPLPFPKTIDVSNGEQVVIGAYKITQKLHSELPPTTLYAYGTSEQTASYPGPTLLATRNKPAHVRWENHIHDSETFLITDRSILWANPKKGGVPIVTHVHGAEVKSANDGQPDAWFTASGETGEKFFTQNYTYPNSQPATLLWYHDHTMGITRINVLAGLAGFYILRSPTEEPKNLPCGDYEIPLVLQDRQFWANGSINFPDIGNSPNHPNWCPEYFGDTIVVNGKVWPYLDVYPTKYRFRMLNGANARFFNLTLTEPSLKFIQIGTDGGFLPFPLNISSLTIGPGYRVDVIIDFSEIAPGTKIYLNNSAAAPFPSGSDAFLTKIPSVLEFRVVPKPSNVDIPLTYIPDSMIPTPRADYNLNENVHRMLTLTEVKDGEGRPLHSLLNNSRWDDPVTETPKLGSVEVWDIINLTPDAHTMHLHLTQFLFVHEQEFNQTLYEEQDGCTLEQPFDHPQSCFTAAPEPAGDDQVGWKDTIIAYPSKVTRLWTKWTTREGGPFSFDATSGPGYVWHCHIVDHEDNDMMRPLIVVYEGMTMKSSMTKKVNDQA
ncbi:hypothetical protein R1flu_028300 [Riccia fluitans]|uniref:Multicopper oxidase n=1 Tax=Riccia fluitans TaxID=41844 RepID=A0ABD1XL92_9MARC